ncbi:MAG: enoyl-CoA hydratase/isomerase family protein [Pseudomonadota bacterium]
MNAQTEGCVRLEIADHIGEIIIDRPTKHNALTPTMYREMARCCEKADDSADVHVVIIRGAGERAFCAGTDVKALEGYEDFWAWRNRFDYIPPILAMRKPCIAAIKGWALGGGLEIVLACDLRVASMSSVFGAPEVTLGWNGAGGAAQHLTRLCGYGQAMRLLLSGERFDAKQAKQMGMIEWLTDEDKEVTIAREVAVSIAAHNPVATQAVKAAVRSAMDLPIREGLRIENELMSLCFAKIEQAKLRAQLKDPSK